MCCTFQPANLSQTTIYAGLATRRGKRCAVLAYQNTASSYSGANAMVLPFPTDVAMGPDNIVDTREGGHFLRDLDASSRPQTRSALLNSVTIGARPDETLQMFKSGSYTVLLTSNVAVIPVALAKVPEDTRPLVSEAFLEGYGARYKGWQIAVCCWRGHLESEPLLWWYEPRKWENRIFIPTLDAHDGNAPQPGQVRVDHTVIWGHEHGEYTPQFRKPLPDTIQELMPARMSAARLGGFAMNGDMWALGGAIERIAMT